MNKNIFILAIVALLALPVASFAWEAGSNDTQPVTPERIAAAQADWQKRYEPILFSMTEPQDNEPGIFVSFWDDRGDKGSVLVQFGASASPKEFWRNIH